MYSGIFWTARRILQRKRKSTHPRLEHRMTTSDFRLHKTNKPSQNINYKARCTGNPQVPAAQFFARKKLLIKTKNTPLSIRFRIWLTIKNRFQLLINAINQSLLFGGISHPTKKTPSPKNPHSQKIPHPRDKN